jgi:hypothetical protein
MCMSLHDCSIYQTCEPKAWTLNSWRWMRHIPLKCVGPLVQWCGVTSQKTSSLNFIKQHETSHIFSNEVHLKRNNHCQKHNRKEFTETLSPMNRSTRNAGRQWELCPVCLKSGVPVWGSWIWIIQWSSSVGKFCYNNGRNGSDMNLVMECSEQYTDVIVWHLLIKTYLYQRE